MPTITLVYSNVERYHKLAQALQQQWKQALSIDIQLHQLEAKGLYEKVNSGGYAIAIGSWFGDISDASNFLEVFSRKDNGTNNTGWESSLYAETLARAQKEQNPHQRAVLLREAEGILMEDM